MSSSMSAKSFVRHHILLIAPCLLLGASLSMGPSNSRRRTGAMAPNSAHSSCRRSMVVITKRPQLGRRNWERFQRLKACENHRSRPLLFPDRMSSYLRIFFHVLHRLFACGGRPASHDFESCKLNPDLFVFCWWADGPMILMQDVWNN